MYCIHKRVEDRLFHLINSILLLSQNGPFLAHLSMPLKISCLLKVILALPSGIFSWRVNHVTYSTKKLHVILWATENFLDSCTFWQTYIKDQEPFSEASSRTHAWPTITKRTWEITQTQSGWVLLPRSGEREKKNMPYCTVPLYAQ